MLPLLSMGAGGGLSASSSSGLNSNDVFAPNINSGVGSVSDSFWAKPTLLPGGGVGFTDESKTVDYNQVVLIGAGLIGLALVAGIIKSRR